MAYATAALAISQIAGGVIDSREARQEASLYQRQASLVEKQQEIAAYQFARQKKKAVGTMISKTAQAGVGLSGSPMAVMLDNLTQMEYDQAIEQYNLEQEQQSYLMKSKIARKSAKTTLWKGILSGTGTFASMYEPKTSDKSSSFSGAGFKSNQESKKWGFK